MKKKGFFEKMVDKIDKKIKKKADESSCCCCGDNEECSKE